MTGLHYDRVTATMFNDPFHLLVSSYGAGGIDETILGLSKNQFKHKQVFYVELMVLGQIIRLADVLYYMNSCLVSRIPITCFSY
jgi:hypothetical protein